MAIPFAVVALAAPAVAYASASHPYPAATVSVRQVEVIPPDTPQTIPNERLFVAGATGFLWAPPQDTDYPVWVSYATGSQTPVPALGGGKVFEPAGGDSVWFWTVYAGVYSPGTASVFNFDTMTWTDWTLPGTDYERAVYGTDVLATTGATDSSPLVVVNLADPADPVTTPVTGLPSGAQFDGSAYVAGDTTIAAFSYSLGGSHYAAVLDLTTGVAQQLGGPFPFPVLPLVTQAYIAISDGGSTLDVYARADLAASPLAVSVPAGADLALAGDQVIGLPVGVTCAPSPGCPSFPTGPAVAIPLSGGPTTTAVPSAMNDGDGLVQGDDGSVLVVGGTGPADWAVRRLNTNSEGELTDTPVASVMTPVANAGLTISQGIVQHAEAGPALGTEPTYTLFLHYLDRGSLGFGSSLLPLDNGPLASPQQCGTDCADIGSATIYGTPFISTGTAVWDQYLDGPWPFGKPVAGLPSASGRIVDTSPEGYVLVDGVQPHRQYLVALSGPQQVIARKVTGAALWLDTLWSATGPGTLRATDLVAKGKPTTVRTGGRCTPTSLQATQRWLYWSCGATGPAGVYDLIRHADIRVPAGPMLLGDGYLVGQDGTDLVLYNVSSDQVSGPQVIATDVAPSPAAATPDVTFAVDKYSGDIAYATAGGDVVVLATNVPTTAPAFTAALSAHPRSAWFGIGGAWSQALSLTRPITSWRLIIRNDRTGAMVYHETGGPSLMGITVAWNGHLLDHHKAAPGFYTWSLSVVASGRTYMIPGWRLILS